MSQVKLEYSKMKKRYTTWTESVQVLPSDPRVKPSRHSHLKPPTVLMHVPPLQRFLNWNNHKIRKALKIIILIESYLDVWMFDENKSKIVEFIEIINLTRNYLVSTFVNIKTIFLVQANFKTRVTNTPKISETYKFTETRIISKLYED